MAANARAVGAEAVVIALSLATVTSALPGDVDPPEQVWSHPDRYADIYPSRDRVPVRRSFTVSGRGFAPNAAVIMDIGMFEVARPVTERQGVSAAVPVHAAPFYRDFPTPITVNVVATSHPDFTFRATRRSR